MPAKKRPKPLYQRGPYKLYEREDRENLEIVWYDPERKRERSASAGSADVAEGKVALDRRYLGSRACPTCHRPYDEDRAEGGSFVTAAVADYLVMASEKASIEAIRARLSHALRYVTETDATIRCGSIDEAWVGRFRKWAIKQPIVSPTGVKRARSVATVEASVAQLAAAINATQGERARFRPQDLRSLNRVLEYRADVKTLARMFAYALEDEGRANLLRFLRASVATWGRPDAVHDISTDPKRRQWYANARVLSLNPYGRKQTKKFRATVPVAHQFAAHLDVTSGHYIPIKSVRQAWERMARELKLPSEGESGMKLIRRSISTIARGLIGEESWVQGRIMLGHVQPDISDLYAVRDPANVGKALAATESIIDQIEALTPGAFYRTLTATERRVHAIAERKK